MIPPYPPSKPHVEQPQDVASIWHAFITTCSQCESYNVPLNTGKKLHQLFSGDILLNLEMRAAFECKALDYCADLEANEDADEAILITLVEYFNWQNDDRHLVRINPIKTYIAMGRYRAAKAYPDLKAKAINGDPYLRVLFAASHPKYSINFSVL